MAGLFERVADFAVDHLHVMGGQVPKPLLNTGGDCQHGGPHVPKDRCPGRFDFGDGDQRRAGLRVRQFDLLGIAKRASASSISAFLPMKAFNAASLFRAAFSARSWWRGVVIGFRRVIVAAPW